MFQWIKGHQFTSEFKEWYDRSSPYPSVKFESPPRLLDVANNNAGVTPTTVVGEFIRAVTEEGKHWVGLDVDISDGRYAREDWTFEFPVSGGSSAPIMAENTHVRRFSFKNRSNVITTDLQFITLRTPSLHLDLRGTTNPIRLEKCFIGKLTLPDLSGLPDEKSDLKPSVEIHDCWIGTLVLHSRSMKKLTVVGGGIANIQCPSSQDENPFLGSVSFKQVFFPSSPKQTKLFQGSDAYGSLSAHLRKLGNTLMANQMRAHQLRAERAKEHGYFARFTNWIYDKFADYGMKPGRPILWLLGVYALVVIYCYYIDDGTLAQHKHSYVGAYAGLLDENGGRLNRSLLLPLQSITNPFGVFFDSRKLIVPSTMWGSILLTIQGLFSDILLVMTALSVRRRYKAE